MQRTYQFGSFNIDGILVFEGLFLNPVDKSKFVRVPREIF